MLNKYFQLVLFILFSITVNAQITEVFAVDSIKYKVGDKIKMGKAMNGLPEFSYCIQFSKDDVSTLQKTKSPSFDSLEIVSITENTKLSDFNVRCRRNVGTDYYITYSFIFNKAIETGEVISKNPKYFVAPTSEQALEQLKKAKEKLDLGLITKDDYDKKVNELKKYIKE